MILHSIIAMDDIFCKNSVSAPMFQEINDGFVELNNCFKEQSEQSLSTNPYHYINKGGSHLKTKNGH